MRADATVPVALTIAGSDSGGGAGIQADLKVFATLGVFGASAITAITAQNPRHITRLHPLPPPLVAAQIRAVRDAFGLRAVKCGVLATENIVRAVAAALRPQPMALVVDPILRAGSGAALLEPRGRRALELELLPLATLATPNLFEARAFLGRSQPPPDTARALARRWGCAVLLKGGHARDATCATDVLCVGQDVTELSAPRVHRRRIHGLGCALSAAITAFLARGHSLLESALLAKEFLTRAIQTAKRTDGHWTLLCG